MRLTNKQWLAGLAALLLPVFAQAEWNAEWTAHKKISLNAQGVTPPLSNFPVAIRLHSGNFDFNSANLDGSDLRFIAADEKTELKYHIEKFDSTNELALIWVQLPKVDAADKEAHVWLYSGNEKATSSAEAKATWDSNTLAAFHFSEKALLQDSSASGLIATGDVTVQKAALLGESAVFTGKPLSIAASNAKLAAGGAYTWSAWVKAASLDAPYTLFSQGALSLKQEGQKLVLNAGANPISGGEIKAASWQHIAFTIENGKASLYVNGVAVATGDVAAATAEGEIKIGEAFNGELDEMQIANVARSAAWLKLAASSQGVDSQFIKLEGPDGDEEDGGGEVNYISILIDSLTLDAKVVIAILGVMFAISVWVMVAKAMLVSRTDKDNKKFLKKFQEASGNLLQLDQAGKFKNSSLFLLYMAGLREIRKREVAGQTLSLSGASMDAIKAAIDADLVRETQRQNAGMVLLTIAISGGPFLGLLGTVVGVMITFAAIAAAGDVNVNAIAPGIAAALLATVAGLGVAIPALFGYNYLASRVKNITIEMQIFVDEFITRVAELHGK